MKKSKLLKIFGTYNKKQWNRIVSVVKKNTADKNSSFRRTKRNRLTLMANCFNYGKSRLIKIEKEVADLADWGSIYLFTVRRLHNVLASIKGSGLYISRVKEFY